MKNILTKLNLIMSEVQYIKKDKTNAFFNYKYASEQAIKETLQPLLVKHKVILQTTFTNPKREVYITAKGARGALTDIDVSYKFWDVESGESLDGTFCGTGDDGADKGTYKAITGAIKYILTSTFLIPTGDDPENDQDTGTVVHSSLPPKAPVKPPQQEISPEQMAHELGYTDEPFESAPHNNLCPTCGKAMVPGKNGKPYCKPCYIKWANENKK